MNNNNNNNRRSRRNGNRSVTNRIVSNKLRAARLTASPTWYKTHDRIVSPPEIPNAPPYAIKIRVLGSSTLLAPLRVTPFSIGSNFTTTFTHLAVSRIDAWTNSSDHTIAVLPYRQIGTTISPDRQFYGTGTEGAIRPYVTISLSKKDVVSQAILSTSQPIVDVAAFDNTGTRIIGQFVVDLWCVFTNSNFQIEANLAAMNLISLQLDEAISPPFEVINVAGT